jgi:hypothetical protein
VATHITESLEIFCGDFAFVALVQAEPWGGHDAATYAHYLATDYVRQCVGVRRFEREYIPAGNTNFMKHNPDHGRKHHMAEPGLGNPLIWRAIFTHWRNTCATDGQRELLDLHDKLKAGYTLAEPDWMFRQGGSLEAQPVSYQGLYVESPEGGEWDGKGKKFRVVPWDEFKNA